MTDLVMMKDVQEKLRCFRENPLSARPPTLNEITVMQFPCEFNKPIEQLSVFVYNLNVLIEKFENLNRYEEIDFLLDAFNYNQKREMYWSRKIVTRKAIPSVSEKASNYH